jgi:hypothetical protein
VPRTGVYEIINLADTNGFYETEINTLLASQDIENKTVANIGNAKFHF